MRVLTISKGKVVAEGQYDVLPEAPDNSVDYLVSEHDGHVGNLLGVNDAGDAVFIEDLGEKHTPAPVGEMGAPSSKKESHAAAHKAEPTTPHTAKK